MINWIVGGLIIGFTLYIIAGFVKRTRRGENSCCSDCTQNSCNCSSNHTDSVA
ncbi:MAG: FeoB-associated Cys-rich membrane protein [Clostridia bacterium]|nr:FeoB-associated Cys-rich membrane protein [Clostridia bacterium]